MNDVCTCVISCVSALHHPFPQQCQPRPGRRSEADEIYPKWSVVIIVWYNRHLNRTDHLGTDKAGYYQYVCCACFRLSDDIVCVLSYRL